MKNIFSLYLIKLIIFCIFIFCFLFQPLFAGYTFAETEETPHKVLLLYSGSEFLPVNAIMNESIQNVLKNSDPLGISLYSEYFEMDRFKSESIQSKLRDVLKEKYSQDKPDLIMVMDDIALDFISKYGNEIFP